VVTNNGGATAEWAAIGPAETHLQVKTLGLCSSIGLGLAATLPNRRVVVFDGDGSLLMNLSSLTTIARFRPGNLLHVVFDNGVYEASGGTPTHSGADDGADLAGIARAAGIRSVHVVTELEAFTQVFAGALDQPGPIFIHARVEPGRAPVPPMPVDEVENKYRFIRAVERLEGIAILARPKPASER
jgi:thiamine pyrophosphate-dependent acetolactate synthase large subunit-like protein